MDIESFIAQHKIKLTHTPWRDYPGSRFDPRASHYKVTLTLGKRALHTEYHKGSAFAGVPPTAAEVLDSAALDATEQGFAEWASDYGYEPENYKEARVIWQACVKMRKNLKFLLGDDAFQVLTEDVERL